MAAQVEGQCESVALETEACWRHREASLVVCDNALSQQTPGMSSLRHIRGHSVHLAALIWSLLWLPSCAHYYGHLHMVTIMVTLIWSLLWLPSYDYYYGHPHMVTIMVTLMCSLLRSPSYGRHYGHLHMVTVMVTLMVALIRSLLLSPSYGHY